MRSALPIFTLLAAVAGCTPEIVPGSYLCGPEQACPAGQACNGVDNTCVLPSSAEPFGCGEVTEVEPNDGLAGAQLVGNLACVSRVAEVAGCVPDSDGEDWFKFSVLSNCTAVAVDTRVAFPIAFERLALDLRDETGAVVATGAACATSDPDDGDDQLCLTQPVTVGGTYALRVARAGEGDCDGACAHNRYTLTVQLTTP